MLEIEMKLLTVFHLQTDGQMEWMNQELKQYLWFFVNYKQKDWPEWLVLAEFVVNNKVHMITKVSPFMANYRREMRMEEDIRKKGKVEKVTEFCYELKSLELDNKTTLVLSNTRELDRELFYKLVYLI